MSNGCVALILAGGANSRADSYREDRPKCLLPLGDGDSILSHLIRALKLHDIHPVILGGLTHDDDADVLADPKEPGIIPALAGAAKYLNHRRDTRILVCYGDTFLPWFDYLSACVPGTMTVAGCPAGGGNVSFEEDGAHYGDGEFGNDWIEAGATCLNPEMLSDVVCFDSWQQYLSRKAWTRVCFHNGPVINVGDADSYEWAKQWQPRN